MAKEAPKAVVLISGGIDSAVTAWSLKVEHGCEVYALSINYGQRHVRELNAASSLGIELGVEAHRFLNIELPWLEGASVLTSTDVAIPDRSMEEIEADSKPATYVPFRNSMMLSIAASWAEAVGAEVVGYGAHWIDSSGYPDCTPSFAEAFGAMMKEVNSDIELFAPLFDITANGKGKDAIIAHGVSLGVPFELTWSCYKGGEKACGRCDSCKLRLASFAKLGMEDPIPYEEV